MTSHEIARRQGIAILIDAINQQQTAYPVIKLGIFRPWLREYKTFHKQVVCECTLCRALFRFDIPLDDLFHYLSGESWIDDRHAEFRGFAWDGVCEPCDKSLTEETA